MIKLKNTGFCIKQIWLLATSLWLWPSETSTHCHQVSVCLSPSENNICQIIFDKVWNQKFILNWVFWVKFNVPADWVGVFVWFIRCTNNQRNWSWKYWPCRVSLADGKLNKPATQVEGHTTLSWSFDGFKMPSWHFGWNEVVTLRINTVSRLHGIKGKRICLR